MCVRLCDGGFFPSNTASGGDAACEAQCPDAPTALYTMPSSQKIEDAVSVAGAPYSSLPVAGRFRSVVDKTCACHREKPDYAEMLLHDRTLRRGDAIMTPKGVVVYQGGAEVAAQRKDFVALAQDRVLTGDAKSSLSRMKSAPADRWRVSGVRTAAQDAPDLNGGKKGAVWIESASTP